MGRLMPQIIRGVQMDFFLRRSVTQTQFLVLMAIHSSAGARCSMGTLAKNLHVSLPTVSGIVARLVRAGQVRRAPDPRDRRQVTVALTAKGESFIRQFQAIVQQRWEEALRPLGASQLRAFHDVVTTLREHLETNR